MEGMPPKRLPIVSIGRPSAKVATEPATTATSMPGQCGRSFRRPRITPMVRRARATAATFTVPAAPASTSSLAANSPGSLPCRVRPNRSLIWLAKMMTAIPVVNPTVTG